MKRVLPWTALLTLILAVGFWFLAGANRGWTKTSVARKSVDEVTGIEAVTYEPKFVPGLDFLGGCVLVAGLLAGTSLLMKNRQPTELET